MDRLSINRSLVWAGALGAFALLAGIVVLTAVITTSSRGADPTVGGVVANGGAKEWVAVDADTRFVTGLNVKKFFAAVNTSNQRSVVNITYVRNLKRKPVCGFTLSPGERGGCSESSRQDAGSSTGPGIGSGYVQVRATQPVIMGGYTQVPLPGYHETTPTSQRFEFAGPGFDATGVGPIQVVPFDWQPGCPPILSSGCAGSPTVTPPAAQK